MIYFQAIVSPKRSFEKVIAGDNYLGLSFLYILIPIVAYTLMYVFLTIGNGAPSVFTPWLNIPKESYYAVNRFLLAPSMLLCWLATTAAAQILSRLFRGTGTFEQTLVVLALSISIAMWGGLIHDLPMSFLSAIGVINSIEHEIAMNSPTIFRTLLWIAYSIYLIAFLVLFSLSVKTVHKLTWFKSIVIGTLSFIIFQTIFFTFNR
jgi:hypothetical protein